MGGGDLGGAVVEVEEEPGEEGPVQHASGVVGGGPHHNSPLRRVWLPMRPLYGHQLESSAPNLDEKILNALYS